MNTELKPGYAIPSGESTLEPSSLLEVDDLTVRFRRNRRTLEAVHGISFSLSAGESLGIVGESGSGKSITALAMIRLLDPMTSSVSGAVRFAGRDVFTLSPRALRKVRGADIAYVFQDPLGSLNPSMRIEHQLTEPLRLHGLAHGRQARQRALEMLELVGINDPARRLRQYPHEISGGMRQRVMIAGALITNPSVVILDEPTTALDATIQAQILELLADLRKRLSMGMLLISHDLGVVAQVTDRVAVMYAGRIVETGATAEVLAAPQHPYTRGLLSSRPRLNAPRTAALTPIPGQPPTLEAHPQTGCGFAPRCPLADDHCRSALPPLGSQTHAAACWKATPGRAA
ncbi:ABC transporter ATP-binding protein [Amycolatopsis tucumanensis]|uniref:ABC transporter ATP-binding protein n=1 Tax=Amycolatopsis tucumanensis TaxID=401106 RepID=A0ABP7I3R6_9PSEU|nr:ABC transporter ATP-binding protein [Amycolatopsis tucumanensis]MCF6426196.1 ABC transporter ATP-binding protein [Amycolatopsis tucumanensis]